MRITEYGILKAERFGKGDEKILFCERCGNVICEEERAVDTDRFGRCFCSEKCSDLYYFGKE